MACHETCKSCITSSSTSCTICVDGLVLTKPEGENVGNCSCEGNCLTCKNLTTLCTSCKQGTFLLGNECVFDCGIGFYGDVVSRKCESMYLDYTMCSYCMGHCVKCTKINICEECSPGYISYGNGQCTCKTECSTCKLNEQNVELCLSCWDGYYYTDGTCTKCSDFCYLCNNGTSCNKCKEGSY